MLSRLTFAGAAVGVIVTIPAALLAVKSGGAGHGDYVAARLLFPVPMLLAVVPTIMMTLALAQCVLYGLVIGSAAGRGRKALVWTVACILVIHFSAVAILFLA